MLRSPFRYPVSSSPSCAARPGSASRSFSTACAKRRCRRPGLGAKTERAPSLSAPELIEGVSLNRAALQTAVGSAAIRDRYEAIGGARGLEVREIVDRIAQDDRRAARVLDEVALCVGTAILAVSAVVDPACVILGGSIGSRHELLGRVQEAVAGCMPVPPAITISQLGSRAGLMGTLAEGLEKLRDELFELDAGPRVAQPRTAGEARS